MLVCATGWTLDLDSLPKDRANQSFDTIQSRLFCRFWDIDYPGLAFVSISNGFMCATENANLVSQAVAKVLLGDWKQPSMEYMVPILLHNRFGRRANDSWRTFRPKSKRESSCLAKL